MNVYEPCSFSKFAKEDGTGVHGETIARDSEVEVFCWKWMTTCWEDVDSYTISAWNDCEEMSISGGGTA